MGDITINWDTIKGQWKQYAGEAKRKWGDFTDDELMEINGNREILAGKLQVKYGIAKDKADEQIDAWARELKK